MKPRKVDHILELVGDTPLVRIQRLHTKSAVAVYAKIEFMNPGGSVKDRAALRMIEAAERSGALQPGQIVLEATSGNTGIGLAMVCAVKGYRMLLAMSESASAERRKILRAYGAEIRLTPGHLSTDGAIEEAYRLAREEPERYFLVDQFNNDDNWRAHAEAGTADEIVDALDGELSVVVATMGTTGTAMGLARRLHELDPAIRLVAVEPYKGHKIQGLKNMQESYAPGIFDPTLPDEIVRVDDEAAYEIARRLAREEGLFVGMSSGAAMKVALDQAAAMESGTVVAILADGGERYLSTPLFRSQKVPVPLRLHNTLTRQLDELDPVRPGHVGIYACGPSLDGPPDLGLCRRMIFADLVRRYLAWRGFEVELVVNLGDIDDRTVHRCLAEGARLEEFTARWEQGFFADMEALGVRPAHHHPRASQHVPEMIEQARQLLDKGVAYEKLRSVYFDIGKAPGYGRLSRVDLDAVRSGKTVDYDYYDKDNPRDFTLFKRSSLAELKAGIYWSTPWGNVRPGWHVECATMATRYLGQPFDLHLASTDLIFPHGENEIAIAAALSDKPLANLWLHCEVVVAGGHKVRRAPGHEVTLGSLVERGHDPAVVRYWMLTQHYRRVLRVDDEQLRQAAARVQRLREFVTRLRFARPGETAPELDQLLYETRQGFRDAMDHDLNVAVAQAQLFKAMRRVNRLLREGQLDAEQLQQVRAFIAQVDEVVGVIGDGAAQVDPEVDAAIAQRDRARAAGDYARADAIRDALAARGVQVIDTADGTRWRRD